MPPDLAHQLQQIYLAGFELQTFDRFPEVRRRRSRWLYRYAGPGRRRLQIMGTPGWRMGEAIGVLVEKGGRQAFQNKQEIVEATPERLQLLARFKEDLKSLLVRQ